jgi:DNA-directed RNA polymerase subunit omega
MARITIEDCLEHIPNRFQLVLLAARRTKQLMDGSKSLIKTKKNKIIVTALREIANGKVSFEAKHVENERSEQ